ncbi:hypothetical protein SEA_WIDOW_59 [Gordonia phage Widow]|nr:hypothetical protein SEA_PUPPERS_59 [Gordonia phage Puppers]UTN93351.1 hypothetical protein SEA_WIDOW_59 [Gordonia phage Widow]
MNHRLGSLPTIGLNNTAPGLHEHGLAKLEIGYPCQCGETVRVSVIQPTDVWTDATAVSYHVSDLGRRAREAWGAHVRGEL